MAAMQESVSKTAVQTGVRTVRHGGTMRRYDAIWLWTSRVIIWFAILITLFPIITVVFASFRPNGSFFDPSFFPKTWTLANYQTLFAKGAKSDFVVWVKNTFILGVSVALITSFVVVLASYAISRMRFRGRYFGLLLIFILQMFPNFMTLPAIFRIEVAIGGFDTIWGMVLVMCGTGAFNIWLMKNFIDNIPRELDEAAMVDGAKPVTIFFRIILPLAKPMLAVLFLWGLMGVINDYVLSAILLRSKMNYTIPLGLKTYTTQFSTSWGTFAAATLLSSLPVVIMWIISNKWVQAGFTQGAVKG